MIVDYHAIGKRIKIARIKLGSDFTQEVLSERTGISLPHISNIETGKTKLSLPTLINIANALSVSVDELLCDNVVRSKAVFEKEAAEVFEDCSDFEVRVIVDILKSTKEALRKDQQFRENFEKTYRLKQNNINNIK